MCQYIYIFVKQQLEHVERPLDDRLKILICFPCIIIRKNYGQYWAFCACSEMSEALGFISLLAYVGANKLDA